MQEKTSTNIQRIVGLSRPTIYKCIDKALAAGIKTGLKDSYHLKRRDGQSEDKTQEVLIVCRQITIGIDGFTFDAEGNIWLTSVCFAGPDHKTVYLGRRQCPAWSGFDRLFWGWLYATGREY